MFVQDLWQSIFTPGTTPTLVKATHASFLALELVLVSMLYATRSLHFVAMIVLASGLWAAITWFIQEAAAYRAKAEKNSLQGVSVDPKDTSTANASATTKDSSALPEKVAASPVRCGNDVRVRSKRKV